MAERFDVLVIGAGFGGASTAWWLRRRGVSSLALLEMEPMAGAHASGRNAGIARQPLADPANVALTVRGASFLKDPPHGFSEHPLFQPTGGFILATRADDEGLDIILRTGLGGGAPVLPATRAEVLQALPVLERSPFQSALLCPTDGLADIHGLLTAYLRGLEVRCGTAVSGFEVSGGRIAKVLTQSGEFRADTVVLAAGAWSTDLGKMAGALNLPMVPKRRHLIHTGPLPWVRPDWPWAWYQTPEVYFRAESGGLLFSPCDEQPMAPCAPAADAECAAWLHERLKVAFPKLAKVPVAHTWAGQRCFVPDNRMVIGKDARLANLFWVTALAGHGMTASSAIGELASALICGQVPPLDPSPYEPSRFEAD